MPNHFAACFWGAPDQQAFLSDTKRLVNQIPGDGVFAGDNLITIGRNLSFLQDEAFQNAFNAAISADNVVGQGIMWRLYLFSWAAQSCLNKPGDFVECGVAGGSSSAIMCKYLNFAHTQKKLFLFDAWGGDERIDDAVYGFTSDTYKAVTQRFAPYPNVHLVRGFIPETLKLAPEAIAFLHIDLNNAQAEIAVLENLFDRVVPGGVILFDDYGATGFAASKIAEDKWLSSRGYVVAELPTGQGLLIK